jgi:hypothetical protein
MLQKYVKSLYKVEQAVDVKEENFYPSLKILLEKFFKSEGRKNIHINFSSLGSEGLIPDIRILNGKSRIIGYIEVILPGTDLQSIPLKDQARKDLSIFSNLILTDFYKFRLYRNREMLSKAEIASRNFISLNVIPHVSDSFGFYDLLDQFLNFIHPRTYTIESLTDLLTKRIYILERVIEKILTKDEKNETRITRFYESYQKLLKSNFKKGQLPWLISRFFTYILLAARLRTEEEFTRKNSYDCFPQTNPILQDLSRYLSSDDLSEEIEWIADDISEILDTADIPGILDEYKKVNNKQEPKDNFFKDVLEFGVIDDFIKNKEPISKTETD